MHIEDECNKKIEEFIKARHIALRDPETDIPMVLEKFKKSYHTSGVVPKK